MKTTVLAAVAFFVFVALTAAALAYIALRARAATTGFSGGGRDSSRGRAAAHSVVVDTLNLAHWGKPDSPIDLAEIVSVIERAAPPIKRQFPGRVYFVVKSRDRRHTDAERAETRKSLERVAQRSRSFVALAERLSSPPKTAKKGHAAAGRDDFYAAVLASKHSWPVLSHDRFRDLGDMKANGLEAFHVWTFSPFGAPPARDFVNPSGFGRLLRPSRVSFGEVPGLREALTQNPPVADI